jgi:hypothetical protein
MTDHPITPPPEMVNEWVRMLEFLPDKQVFSEVAQWGADVELDACCKWFADEGYGTAPYRIRMHRRPEPPSLKGLKEQALRDLNHAYKKDQIDDITFENIQEALEALPND